jgi:hypothetical protein
MVLSSPQSTTSSPHRLQRTLTEHHRPLLSYAVPACFPTPKMSPSRNCAVGKGIRMCPARIAQQWAAFEVSPSVARTKYTKQRAGVAYAHHRWSLLITRSQVQPGCGSQSLGRRGQRCPQHRSSSDMFDRPQYRSARWHAPVACVWGE